MFKKYISFLYMSYMKFPTNRFEIKQKLRKQ